MQYGEIYKLGEHKLMCGDATRREDVYKLAVNEQVDLVLQDPPYGINVQAKKGNGSIGSVGNSYPKCIGDNDTSMCRENYQIIRTLCNSLIIFGGQNFTDFLPPTCGWIFWDKCKNSDKLSFSDGELAWSNCSKRIKKYSHKWNGYTREGSRELNERVHVNQKPVELFMKIIEDFTCENNTILDCFGGSGTTLIACEQVKRKCLMMEISREYCDLIIKRYEDLTGIKAERID